MGAKLQKTARAFISLSWISLDVLLKLSMVLVLTVALFIAWLGTQPGRDWVAGHVERLAADDNLAITIGQLESLRIGGAVVTGLEIADHQGVWLTVDRLAVDINYRTLFARTIDVDSIIADTVSMWRLPQALPDDEPPAPVEFTVPELPRFDPTLNIPDVNIGALEIGRLHIGEDVYGQAEDFALAARVVVRPRNPLQSEVRLVLESLDRPDGGAWIAFHPDDLDPDAYHAMLQVDGGAAMLLGQLAGLDDGNGLYVSLASIGDPEHWVGRLQVNAEGVAQTEALVRAIWTDDLTLNVEGALSGPILPGLDLDYDAVLSWERTGRIALRQLNIESAAGEIQSQLFYRPDTGEIDARIAGTVPALNLPDNWCPDCRIERAAINATVAGRAPYPPVTAQGHIERFTYPGIIADTVNFNLTATPLQRPAPGAMPYDLRGRLNFSTTLFPPGDFLDDTLPDAYLTGPVNVVYGDNRYTIEAALQGPGDIYLTGMLSAPLDPLQAGLFAQQPITGNIQGSTDIEIIANLVGLDIHRVGGMLDADIRIGGTLTQPDFTGAVTLRDGFYENLIHGTHFRDIQANARLSQTDAVIERLSLRDLNGGTLTGSGRIDLSDLGNPVYLINVESRRLQVLASDALGVMVSGTLQASGDAESGALEGDLRIDGADIYVRDLTGGGDPYSNYTIIEIGAADGDTTRIVQEAEVPYLMTLNVNVRAQRGLYVRGYGLDSEWGADLALTGTTRDPHIVGRLFLVRGRFEIIDLVVNLQEGTLRFTGDPGTPDINVAGLIRGRGLDATLTMTGTPQNPAFGLTTEQGLPEDEILAQLLFGQSMLELSPGQALRVAQILATLTGGGPGGGILDPLGLLRQSFGLDMLTVGIDDETGPTLAAGRYISDQVYVGVEQGTQPGTGRVRAEIDITDRITAETQLGGAEEGRVGVRWRWDY